MQGHDQSPGGVDGGTKSLRHQAVQRISAHLFGRGWFPLAVVRGGLLPFWVFEGAAATLNEVVDWPLGSGGGGEALGRDSVVWRIVGFARVAGGLALLCVTLIASP